jgi:hypothetical protein
MDTGTQHRQRVFAAITIALTLAALLVLLNVLITSRPTLFGQYLGNYVLSRYGTKPGDMYFHVPELDAYLMWPDFETRAYYNGYFWHHETDSLGFRNPAGRRGDIVLHGDSMIYGHGVEVERGVSEVLHDRYGWPTYNISQQGDCLYQTYLKSRLYLDDLSPRVVIHFAFQNDVRDLEIYRTPEQIEQMPVLDRGDWKALRAVVQERGEAGGGRRRIVDLPAIRFLRGAWREMKERFRRRATPDPEDLIAAPLLAPASLERAQHYYDRMLTDLARRVRASGSELVVVHLDAMSGGHPDARSRFRELLRTATARAGVRLFDTGDTLLDCEECTLPRDGHLSGQGHAVLASMVDDWLREIGLRPEHATSAVEP